MRAEIPRSLAANVFAVAQDILRDAAQGYSACPERGRDAALGLLEALDYGRPVDDERRVEATAEDPGTQANRLALLALAARLDRTFRLPMRHAPGAFFFGAMASPERFAIPGQPATGVGGRGLTLRRAFESCIGEAAEYLSFIARGDEPTVNGDGRGGLDANELAWVAGALGIDGERRLGELDWIATRSLADGRGVMFPAELVLRRPAAKRKTVRAAESAGVGAGPTRETAILSGLLEVIERDAVALWWYGGTAARSVGPDLAEDPEFDRFITALRGDSDRIWWLLDITSDIGVPTFAALSAEWDGRAVVAGSSAGLDARAAARSAVLEMCQMELAQELALDKLARDGEAALGPRDRLWIARARGLTLDSSPQLLARAPARAGELLPNSGNLIAAVIERLRGRGLEAYAVDLTRPDLAIPVVRVIVPGLQSAKPEWITPRLAAAAESNGQSLDRMRTSTAPI